MGKIIAAGHICLDITPKFPESGAGLKEIFTPGKLTNVEAADVHTGGSVANTGLALKLLGNDVRLIGKVGTDAFGGMVNGILSGYGVEPLTADAESVTSYSVVVAVPGSDRIFLHCPGANNTFTGADVSEEALSEAVLFHFGYPPIMRRMFENDGEELVRLFVRVKEKGIATSLDMAAVDPSSAAGAADWRRILQRVLPLVDFFVPSYEELCFMLDRERYDRLSSAGGDMTVSLTPEEIRPLLDETLAMGCGSVLIKCGTRGMMYRTACAERLRTVGSRLPLDSAGWADREGYQPCFTPDTVKSATGAGDTAIAAFLTAVLLGRAPEECARLAAAEGACCVTEYDALSGLKTIPALEEKIASGWRTR